MAGATIDTAPPADEPAGAEGGGAESGGTPPDERDVPVETENTSAAGTSTESEGGAQPDEPDEPGAPEPVVDPGAEPGAGEPEVPAAVGDVDSEENDLVAAEPAGGPPPADAGPAPAPEGPQRPPEPKFGSTSATGRGMTIAGASLTGAGAGLVVAAYYATRCRWDGLLRCKYADQDTFMIPSAIAVTGIGVVLLMTGLGHRMKYKKWENWNAADRALIVPTPLRGGAGVSLAGSF